MKAAQKCIDCCRRKALGFIEHGDMSGEERQKALREIDTLMETGAVLSAPELMSAMLSTIGRYTGIQDSYARPKALYNRLLLSKEESILDEIRGSDDPFLAGIQYAVTGNYIDFAGVADVQEAKLQELLDNRADIRLDTDELASLKAELSSAGRLLYITDNAGEIVLDKIFIRVLKELYPNLEIAVLVRELPVLNDATLEDALEIGMDSVAAILPNGTCIPGTVADKLPARAAEWLDSADLCIAKGQGNFETLCGSGLNVYFLFLCKCELFTDAFGVEQYTPVLRNEKRLTVLL